MIKQNRRRKSERGIALLVALMGLLLLAVIGVGFMFMSDTENSVNNNYRDSQVSYFASRAGLENVRLLLGAGGPLRNQALAMDGTMPSGTGGVIYVTNATGTENIDPTSGDYADDELCQELFSALNTSLGNTTVTPGVPCTPLPNTSAYFAKGTGLTVNTSNPANSDIPYTKTAEALPFKWVRITNKQNLMGLVAFSGPNATATVDNSTNYSLQVCYDATHTEITIPKGDTCAQHQALPVWLLTSMAVTPRLGNRPGSKRVTQMEIATAPSMLPPGVVSTQAPLLFHGSSVSVNAIDNCSCNPSTCQTNSSGATSCNTRTSLPSAAPTTCDGTHHSAYTAGTVSTNGQPTATSGFGSSLTGAASVQNVSPWPYNINKMIDSYKASSIPAPFASSCTGTANFTAIPPTYLACGTQTSQTFGTYPGMDSTGALNNNPAPVPQTTYIPGSVQLTSNASGSGVLIVDGDLDIHGGLNFYGLVLVRGQVTFSGGGSSGTNLYGAILAGGDITNVSKSLVDTILTDSFGGNVNLQYDVCALKNAQSFPSPKVLATHEIQY